MGRLGAVKLQALGLAGALLLLPRAGLGRTFATNASLSVRPFVRVAPVAVTDSTARPGALEGSVALRWTAPAVYPGSTLDSYQLRVQTFSAANVGGSTTAWWNNATGAQFQSFYGVNPGQTVTRVIGPAPANHVMALQPGASYYFAVRSADDMGTGINFWSGSSNLAAAIAKGLAPPPVACTITSPPSSGFTTGGNLVIITGTDFNGLSGPDAVAFDGVAASAYSVNAASTVITAMAPRHPLTGPLVAGPVPLTVTTSAGTHLMGYNYIVAPVGGNGLCGDDFFFPSPATGATGTFAYCMDESGNVTIKVYNMIGDLAAKLEDAKPAGSQSSTLNTGRMAPGVYLYRIEKNYHSGTSTHSSVKKFAVKH